MKTTKFVNISLFIVLVVATVTVVYSAFLSPEVKQPLNPPTINFSQHWTYIDDSNISQSISLPFNCTPAEKQAHTITKTLPKDLPPDSVIYCQINHNRVKAFVGNKELFVSGVYTDRVFGTFFSELMATIPLDTEYAGQPITLQISERLEKPGISIGNVQIINKNQLTLNLIKDDLLTLILFVSMMTLSIILLVISIIGKCKNKSFKFGRFVYLALFVFIASVWILADSKVLQLLFGYNDYQIFLSFYSFMLMPVPFALFIQEMLTVKRPILNLLAFLFMTAFLVNLVATILGIIHSPVGTLIVTHILMFILCGIVLYLCIYDYLKYKNTYVKTTTWGILIFAPISILALAIFYLVESDNYANPFRIGLFIFVIFLSFGAIKYLTDVIKKAAESELNKLEALQAQNHLKVNQISTHFFYHVLSTTRVLTKTNPEVAYKMLGNIAKYLRYKTDSSEICGSFVKFSDEMKSIKAYVDMQKVLLGERLNMIYDTDCDDFYIPVLTIQPLVENAIVHGIAKKEGGGTVRIAVTETADYHVVVVEDDGVGFNKETVISSKNISVSQSNICERLSYYGDNEILIVSIPNEGTKITVKFSKKLTVEKEENKKEQIENHGGMYENNFS